MTVCANCIFYDKHEGRESFGDCLFVPPPWLAHGLHYEPSEEGDYFRSRVVRAADYCSLRKADD